MVYWLPSKATISVGPTVEFESRRDEILNLNAKIKLEKGQLLRAPIAWVDASRQGKKELKYSRDKTPPTDAHYCLLYTSPSPRD